MARTRTHYKPDERERLLKEYRTGAGADPAEFARRRGIRPATFRTWLSRYRARRGGGEEAPPVKFVEVAARPAREVAVEIRIGEVALRLPTELGPEFIADVARHLAARPC